MNTTGKDLTKEAPVSPYTKLGAFVILPRTIDKCRALLWGNIGEYHFDCPVDNSLFGWKGIKGDDFKAYVKEGHTNDEILAWVMSHGEQKTDADIKAWNMMVINNKMANSGPEKKAWLEGENVRVGIDKDSTLFEMLVADDKISFK